MNLKTLLASLQNYETFGPLDAEITGISYDSRKVQEGHLFVALPGSHVHGSQFVAEAERAAAAAVLTDRKIQTSLPLIVTPVARLALAHLSNSFYSFPSTRLKLFAVTGTNGKTTTTFLLHSILEAAFLRCGLIGTIQYSGGTLHSASPLTTPESLDLQQLLAAMISEGCSACAMEVSSHSLSQYRVGGCVFEAAIFSNLTQDHLDYHGTMEDYFQAKRMLFTNVTCRTKKAVVNLDDSYGRRILSARDPDPPRFYSYGFDTAADFHIHRWVSSTSGSEIILHHNGTEVKICSPLFGRFNAYNVCAAFAATTVSGIQPNFILRGLENMKQVPGRLERIDCGQEFLILIDYAHTEDALRQLLATVRPYAEKKLILLFGCGGDRDRGKRPLMGRAAGELADEVILTSDNPRNEDPDVILQEILAGIQQSGNNHVHIVPDRKEAIAYAVQLAQCGDVLILAGKGHENYQIMGNQKLHFDEREILREILSGKTQGT